MNVNGIGQQAHYDKTNGVKGAYKGGGGFYERLSENINDKLETSQKKGETAATKSMTAGYSYRNVVAAVDVQESDHTGESTVFECEVRQITYQESDYVKVSALQGFTLVAQVNKDERNVYVEKKMEDGTKKGYLVDIDQVEKDTKDPIEQAALEAWEKSREEEESDEKELSLEEALAQFYDMIQDRIKNGPPKIKTGSAEFSIEEWDKLIESIDEQIDAIREEMRERIEKLKEQWELADQRQEQLRREELNKDSEEEEIEEELLSSLFQDMKNSGI